MGPGLERRAKGTIHVFTYKDGVLSAVAHDLRFRIEAFAITLDGESVRAELDLRTLLLDGPVRGGVVHPEDYDAHGRAQVERAAREDVLHVDRHPLARFEGRAALRTAGARTGGFVVGGQLELAGRTAPLSFEIDERNGAYVAAIELRPTLWGIAPYRALLGAIRLKDVVRVELALTDA